jgi:hypothetical protein
VAERLQSECRAKQVPIIVKRIDPSGNPGPEPFCPVAFAASAKMDTYAKAFTFRTVGDGSAAGKIFAPALCFEAQKKTENTGEIRRKWNGSSLAQKHVSANKGAIWMKPHQPRA